MQFIVVDEGVSMNVPESVVLEPDQTVTVAVEYTPATAQVDVGSENEEYVTVSYDQGQLRITGVKPTKDLYDITDGNDGYALIYVDLYDENKEFLMGWGIPVYVAEKQISAQTTEEALAEANAKVEKALENNDRAAVLKIVNEVVEKLAEVSQTEVNTSKDAIDELEAKLAKIVSVDNQDYTENGTELETTGALLNLIAAGEKSGKMIVVPVEDPQNTEGVTLDIKLQKDSNGENITKLAMPMQIRLKATGIDLTKNIRIRHTKENGTTEWIYPTVDGEYIVFWVNSFSEFAISNYTRNNSGSSSGGGGGGSSKNTTSGTVSSDSRKGYVNSITGIITGSGAGYSKWNQDTTGWKLQYADGTFAAGAMVTDENGSTHEQVAWEMINGAWYPFGADGYAKGGMVYDAALGGTFYVDINTGMKTGWQQIDGVWYYFNTSSDGKRGIMLKDTTVDGYYINADGIWQQ